RVTSDLVPYLSSSEFFSEGEMAAGGKTPGKVFDRRDLKPALIFSQRPAVRRKRRGQIIGWKRALARSVRTQRRVRSWRRGPCAGEIISVQNAIVRS
ncbi:MAG TPA: hypothetical protein VKA97_01125, partial [Pyrinomonadaceae bacterium]|nr:hypothetical protein [Pyrinomonadaceae bacterium]